MTEETEEHGMKVTFKKSESGKFVVVVVTCCSCGEQATFTVPSDK